MSNNKSPISINEHLSALLDEESGSFESRRVLDELKTDKALTQKLSNYALIGETMRTGDSEKQVLTFGSSFLDGIHEKIALEDDFNQVVVDTQHDVNHSADASNSSSWLRPVGGFAVAASIGALAFMGLQNMGLLNDQNTSPDGIANSSAPIAIVKTDEVKESDNNINTDSIAAVTNDGYIDADAQTRSMLKRYVDSHMQYATTSSFVPAVRVIAYTDHQ